MTDADGVGPSPHDGRRLEAARAYAWGAGTVLPGLLATPRLPPWAVRRIARRRLRAIADHARRHCPHYRDTLRGVDLEAIARDGDASRIPLLERATLRDRSAAMLDERVDPARLAVRSSSGSSGVPTRVRFDPLRELPRRLQELRLLTAHGFRLTDRQLVFDHPGHLHAGRLAAQRLGLWRRIPYPWQVPTEEGLAFIEGGRFEVLHGVLSSLRLLALAARERGGLAYRPRLILSKGELLDDATRALIEGALRAPLVDYYATEEVGIIAWQAPGERGYRVDADLVHLEVVDPETGAPLPAGELGEVVLTSLYMRAMPILRFRTGDLGVLDPAPPPGSGLPLLRSLSGRAMDCVVTPEGDVHHPFAMLGPLEDSPELDRYRVRQPAPDRLDVGVRFREDVPEAARAVARERVRRALAERLGPAVAIAVVPLDETSPGFGRKDPLVSGLGLRPEELAGRRVRL